MSKHPWLAFVLLVAAVLAFVSPLPAQNLDDFLDAPASPDAPVVAPPGNDTPPPPPAASSAVDTGDVEGMRARIVALAGADVGKVDHAPGPDGFKIGWERLKEFYEVAYRLQDLTTQRPYWLKMLKAPYKRIEGGPSQWCGIFNAYAWGKAGLNTHWDTRIVGCKYRGDTKNIQPGDICIIKKALNPYNHHCLVKSREGDAIVTIDGNQEAQRVMERHRSIKDIEIFYSVADAMGAPLPKAPPTPGGGGTPAVPPVPPKPGSVPQPPLLDNPPWQQASPPDTDDGYGEFSHIIDEVTGFIDDILGLFD